jgi:hypothetical protein
MRIPSGDALCSDRDKREGRVGPLVSPVSHGEVGDYFEVSLSAGPEENPCEVDCEERPNRPSRFVTQSPSEGMESRTPPGIVCRAQHRPAAGSEHSFKNQTGSMVRPEKT